MRIKAVGIEVVETGTVKIEIVHTEEKMIVTEKTETTWRNIKEMEAINMKI